MQEIKRENLISGKEYYLQYSFEVYKMIGTFESVSSDGAKFSNFRRICERYKCWYNRSVKLVHHWKFYEINSNNVQKNMENRAYQMIILNIVNDEYFRPIDVL
jgi:hypothetical protein